MCIYIYIYTCYTQPGVGCQMRNGANQERGCKSDTGRRAPGTDKGHARTGELAKKMDDRRGGRAREAERMGHSRNNAICNYLAQTMKAPELACIKKCNICITKQRLFLGLSPNQGKRPIVV